MHAFQESGVAGVVADGVEERVYADECHVQSVVVERVLEGIEGMVEVVDSKIIDADLVRGAGVDRCGEESECAGAPIGLPSMFLIHGNKSGDV